MKYDKTNAEDKALNLFADMMIEKIENVSSNWQQPWFTNGFQEWPKNLNGREYNGMNALMLMFLCEKKGYSISRFCTFDCIQRLNQSENNSENPQRVFILKGEKSFPILLVIFICVNKDTKEKIKWEEYKKLSDTEKEKYDLFPRTRVFRVFNVAQTNIKQSRPELWQKLVNESKEKEIVNTNDNFTFAPMDKMISEQRWICPINTVYGNSAYFSISKNEIVVPQKEQFKDGESFYTNLFHEMAHSTGHETQLARLKKTSFGSADYAREELVAELTAALTATRYGMAKHIKEDSASYIKSWLKSLKEDAQFIKTTLFDVKRASRMLTEHIDAMTV